MEKCLNAKKHTQQRKALFYLRAVLTKHSIPQGSLMKLVKSLYLTYVKIGRFDNLIPIKVDHPII